MADMRKLETLTNSGRPLPALPDSPAYPHPSAAPPYSSLISDALRDICIHKYKDKLRLIALHQVKLKAGQSALPNGGLGRDFLPPSVPEMRGGKILSGSI
jgi:hypothetical protein